MALKFCARGFSSTSPNTREIYTTLCKFHTIEVEWFVAFVTYLHMFVSAARLVYQRPSGAWVACVIHAPEGPLGSFKKSREGLDRGHIGIFYAFKMPENALEMM
jgi:hypothetical protein